ncbi:MAG: hypothetical protein WCO56_28060 [Verrucomicrobiota bacterium]
MMTLQRTAQGLTLILASGMLLPIYGADETTNGTQTNRTEIREKFRHLTPEEREIKLKEMHEKHGNKTAETEKRKEELKNLPPAEREAKLKEFREKHGGPAGNPLLEKLREELKNLPPEQREAKLKEFKEQHPELASGLEKKHQDWQKLPPEERAAKAKEYRAKMDTVLEKLRQKKAAGTLSDEQAKRLERMEEMRKKIEQSQDKPPGPPPR